MVKIVCNVCGSEDIEQEASIMLDPNKEWPEKAGVYEFFRHTDFTWQDYYWCKECEDETTIHEVGPGIGWEKK